MKPNLRTTCVFGTINLQLLDIVDGALMNEFLSQVTCGNWKENEKAFSFRGDSNWLGFSKVVYQLSSFVFCTELKRK
jgi:hypothetical protein